MGLSVLLGPEAGASGPYHIRMEWFNLACGFDFVGVIPIWEGQNRRGNAGAELAEALFYSNGGFHS